jgi:hypothetical protein
MFLVPEIVIGLVPKAQPPPKKEYYQMFSWHFRNWFLVKDLARKRNSKSRDLIKKDIPHLCFYAERERERERDYNFRQ